MEVVTAAEEGTFWWYTYLVETNPHQTQSRWNAMSDQCPTREVLGRIAEKWTVLVVTALAEEEVLRFSELQRRIQGVTQKMLTQTLRGLERDGLVTRTVYPTVPATVEYRLTDLGRSLIDVVVAIRTWAYGNVEAILAARRAYAGTALESA